MTVSRRRTALGLAGLGLAGCAATARPGPPFPPGQDWRLIPRTRKDRLGEGIMWSPRRRAIFWVDILEPHLSMLTLDSGEVRHWPLGESITWILEREGRDDFLVGGKRGFSVLTLEPFSITPFGHPEPDLPKNRLNDAKTHPSGRFIYAGTMTEGSGPPAGSLYRIDRDLTWRRLDTGYGVCNGPTFSLDGRIMFHADSPRKIVYAYDVGADGALSNRRIWRRFPDEWGAPDGMTTDADGFIWICHWDGARVSRFRPDAALDRHIALPARQVANCTFAGPGLDRMFVTSAALGSDRDAAVAGALYEVRPGARGLPPPLFKG
jgi:sugar lactone lactonase YvrE